MVFQCDYCSNNFKTKYGLNKHVQKACKAIFVEKKVIKVCLYCDKEYDKSWQCKKHMEICIKNPDKGKEVIHVTNDKNNIQQQTNIQQMIQNNNYGNYFDIKIIQNINIDDTNDSGFVIFSIPTVNDKAVYSDEYCQNVRNQFDFDKERYMSNYYDSFPFLKVYIDYIMFVYFNENYPMNFSFMYHKGEYGPILIKEDEQWGQVSQAIGLYKLFKNIRKNFTIYMNYFRSLEWMQEDIAKQNTDAKNLTNYFNGALDRFLFYLKDIDMSDTFSKKTKDTNLTENAIQILDKFISVVKCQLLEKQKIMKKWYTIDQKNNEKRKNMFTSSSSSSSSGVSTDLTTTVHDESKLFQLMKQQIEEKLNSLSKSNM